MPIGTGLGIAIGGLAAAGSGIAGAAMSSNAASEASDAAAQVEMSKLAFSREQWNHYLDTYGPVEAAMLQELGFSRHSKATGGRVGPSHPMSGTEWRYDPDALPAGFERSLAGINRGYDDAIADVRRSMATKYGSGSGLANMATRNLNLGRTRAISGAWAGVPEAKLSRMGAFLGRQPNLAGSSAGLAGSADLTRMALGAQNAAAGAASAAGQGMADAMQLMIMAGRPQTQPATAGVQPRNYWGWDQDRVP